jgi:hypothetical protein
MKKRKEPSKEYKRFEETLKNILSVPKSEIDKREAEYQKQKKNGKKKRAA